MKRISDIITVLLFCLIIASLTVAFFILPDRQFSPQENRNLAQAPQFNSEALFNGSFGNKMNDYFSDQFPLRDLFVKIKSGNELLMLKGENNGVLYSYNQLAVKDFDAYISILENAEDTDRISISSAKLQIESLNKLSEKLNVPLIALIPPRTIDVADDSFDYNRPDGDAVFDIAKNTLGDSYIDALSDLRSRYNNGEYVYYRTDHHWTTLGAYYAYCDIMERLGKEESIIPQKAFSVETVYDFSGTTAAKANFPFYKKDSIEIWHFYDDKEYEIVADGEALNGFYNLEYADKSDKYSLFLDGTHNITLITKPDEERETLVVVKDSFANCLIPFLAREYNIVAVNIHNVNAISALAENYGADAVLVVCNMENLITTGDLGKLN